ncbi:MAG TPA: xanthine dehydrogenase family protein molybdopterin-binding subunit [Actinomycetota bacterium]|nr:xanthine dehydrogenase family protein molybdopterin-binding subunit [Actinomycetota bacterium]
MSVPPSTFGIPALRTEDPRFLRGEGRYLENVDVPGSLRAVFVRSIFPHAVLKGVEGLPEARSMSGVAAVYTAEDLGIPARPPSGNVEAPGGTLERGWEREVLARDRLRYAGEPFAVVIARTRAEGEDAAEAIAADVDVLEPVVDAGAAGEEGAPLLWPSIGTNVAHRLSHRWDEDVMVGADVVVRGRFVNQRLAPVPMEANGIAVIPTDDGYDVWVSTQVPFDVRDDLAELLEVDRQAVHTIAPDVGGGFGAKGLVYPEYLVVARAAQLLRRPIRWFETRSESMLSLWHGRGQVQHVEIGARRDGELVGLRVDLVADMGAYPLAAFLPATTGEMLSGVYRIPRIAYRASAIVTNTTPIGAYRGAGRPEAAACIERAVDLVADELGLDPVEVRRRNLIAPDAFPYETAAGTTYDSGNYAKALNAALALAGYDELRAQQAERRGRDDHLLLGVGVSTYVEITSFSSREFARVDVEDDGRVTVYAGTSSHGQGHETAFAQLAAGAMGLPLEAVTVVHSDTARVERGEGTWGSRSLQAGGSSVATRAGEVVEVARGLAADVLEVDAADLEGPSDGAFRVAGAPDRRITWAELASAATDRGIALSAKGVYREPGSTFPFGAHVAVVEVDRVTGGVELLRHVAVDDCGRILNPMLVRGQQHGGIAQGIAQALYEEVTFDEAGNPITGTLATYLMPSAADLPALETTNTETPTSVNPLGAKGIGESGSIGATPAIQNAVVDALSHLGVRHVDLPCSPERVWRALRSADGAAPDVR